jgi:hypothetical protein
MMKANQDEARYVRLRTAEYLLDILIDRKMTRDSLSKETGLDTEIVNNILLGNEYHFSELLLVLQVMKVHLNFDSAITEFFISDPQLN